MENDVCRLFGALRAAMAVVLCSGRTMPTDVCLHVPGTCPESGCGFCESISPIGVMPWSWRIVGSDMPRFGPIVVEDHPELMSPVQELVLLMELDSSVTQLPESPACHRKGASPPQIKVLLQ